jgi:hypothetical protein
MIAATADEHEACLRQRCEHLGKRLDEDVDALDGEVARGRRSGTTVAGASRAARSSASTSTPGDTTSMCGARRCRVTPLAEASETAVTRARLARSKNAANRSSDSSMPCSVASSGEPGDAIAASIVVRIDCVWMTSGRNFPTSERSVRNQSADVRARGRSATRWKATPAAFAPPRCSGGPCMISTSWPRAARPRA